LTVAAGPALGPIWPSLLPIEHWRCVPEGPYDTGTALNLFRGAVLLQLQLFHHVTSRNHSMCAELGWASCHWHSFPTFIISNTYCARLFYIYIYICIYIYIHTGKSAVTSLPRTLIYRCRNRRCRQVTSEFISVTVTWNSDILWQL
jgi:hypothetical protein